MNTYRPVLVSPKAANLLIFLPRTESRSESRAEANGHRLPEGLYDALQHQFGNTLRILKIDDATHPEVIASFGVGQRPAFVLVQKGAEIWRQEGLTDFEQLRLALQSKVESLPVGVD